MPIRYNTGEYSYDLEYHNGDMSISMELLKVRLINLLEPYFADQYVKWREAYFVWFTKCGGDQGWMFCVGRNEFHIDGALRRYYSGKSEIIYVQKDRYFCIGKKKHNICKTCRGFGFIRDDAFGFLDKCEKCEVMTNESN